MRGGAPFLPGIHEAHLVGEADRRKRAARAFGTVVQGWRVTPSGTRAGALRRAEASGPRAPRPNGTLTARGARGVDDPFVAFVSFSHRMSPWAQSWTLLRLPGSAPRRGAACRVVVHGCDALPCPSTRSIVAVKPSLSERQRTERSWTGFSSPPSSSPCVSSRDRFWSTRRCWNIPSSVVRAVLNPPAPTSSTRAGAVGRTR